jgi:excisionase family DNA binding protein
MERTMLMTQRQVAELTHISERTLERWRVIGSDLPYVKLGYRVMYRREDVEKWIDSHVVNSTSEAKKFASR